MNEGATGQDKRVAGARAVLALAGVQLLDAPSGAFVAVHAGRRIELRDLAAAERFARAVLDRLR